MAHLHSIDKTCEDQFDLLLPRLKASEGVTEKLKMTDQLEWVRRMNSIYHRIEETLLNELIYA